MMAHDTQQKQGEKMNEPILSVDNVSKKFCRNLKRSLWYGVKDLAGEMLLRGDGRAELRRDEFWALEDVSFELHQGETLGIIGRNGAGKSTLLKLINGLIKPDMGSILVQGRVGALIELGAGFNPILTGRENIYVNAAVLGLPRKEVDRRLDEIIKFAEIDEFIDAPVQSYSSGMRVRLGFSVATHLNPDLLLIDEVLSVGDSSFRERCYNHLNEFRMNGGSVIFISHNTLAVEAICDRVVVLDHGRTIDTGDPARVIEGYEQRMMKLSRQADLRLHHNPTMDDANDIRITAVECYDMAGNRREEFEFGKSFEVRLHYETNKDIHKNYFVVAIRKGSRHDPLTSAMNMMWDDICLEDVPRQGVVGCVIEDPSFTPGTYGIHLGVAAVTTGALGQKWYMPPQDCGSFTVLPGRMKEHFPGVPATHLVSGMPPVVVAHSWKLNGQLLARSKVNRLRLGEFDE